MRLRADIFLEAPLRKRALKHAHPFLGLVSEVLHEAGMEPNFRPIHERGRMDASALSLIHMKPPASTHGLVFRQVYHPPFWQIEATHERWNWSVALADYKEPGIGPGRAAQFRDQWRARLFPGIEAVAGRAIYVPLQGKLLERRGFQSCAPIEMVQAVRAATDRPVVVALHPGETYTEEELAALRAITPFVTGGMTEHLPACAAVVTMNSGVGFNALFFDKPVVLMGEIDYHHIACKATPGTLGDTLESAIAQRVDRALYLWWFWQIRAINAGRATAKDKIRRRLVKLGWPMN